MLVWGDADPSLHTAAPVALSCKHRTDFNIMVGRMGQPQSMAAMPLSQVKLLCLLVQNQDSTVGVLLSPFSGSLCRLGSRPAWPLCEVIEAVLGQWDLHADSYLAAKL